MTKSYKMLILEAMLEEDALPGSIGIERLTEHGAAVARRHPTVREELGEVLDDPEALRALFVRNPIRAWIVRVAVTGTGAYVARHTPQQAFAQCKMVHQLLVCTKRV